MMRLSLIWCEWFKDSYKGWFGRWETNLHSWRPKWKEVTFKEPILHFSEIKIIISFFQIKLDCCFFETNLLRTLAVRDVRFHMMIIFMITFSIWRIGFHYLEVLINISRVKKFVTDIDVSLLRLSKEGLCNILIVPNWKRLHFMMTNIFCFCTMLRNNVFLRKVRRG